MNSSLAELVQGLGAELTGPGDTPILEIAHDSRRVAPGQLFVALRGQSADGHDFVHQAARAGAAALLVDRELPDPPDGIPRARVADARAALPLVARRLFGDPARDLTLVGITGTNGKTSSVRMLESVLRAAGLSSGSMGTISVRYPGAEEPAELTTAESSDLLRSLKRMRDAGASHAVVEVSSHALALGRVSGLRFEVAVCTNLSQDHLDFHGDMESYAEAKARLFGPDHLAGTAVVKAGDAFGERLAERALGAGARVIRFGRENPEADVSSSSERVSLEGARFEISAGERSVPVKLTLPGDYQLENALAAAGAALALGIDLRAVRCGLASCPPVPGRLERVGQGRPIVLVDYAHTPEALERVLSRVRPLVRGRLISVFGCGGDRDRSKRAPMARAACAHSDHAIATSDNPRTEDPGAILRDLAEGLSGSHETIQDRSEAIAHAIRSAAPDDVVVIAGKGHETYQIVGRTKRDFDDRVEARRALETRGERA